MRVPCRPLRPGAVPPDRLAISTRAAPARSEPSLPLSRTQGMPTAEAASPLDLHPLSVRHPAASTARGPAARRDFRSANRRGTPHRLAAESDRRRNVSDRRPVGGVGDQYGGDMERVIHPWPACQKGLMMPLPAAAPRSIRTNLRCRGAWPTSCSAGEPDPRRRPSVARRLPPPPRGLVRPC